MNNKVVEIVEREWDQQGECASCSWHASLSEYDLPVDIVVNREKGRIELPCLSKDDEYRHTHRGVRIYYKEGEL